MKKLAFTVAALFLICVIGLSAQDVDNLRFHMTIKDLNSLSTAQIDEITEKADWLLLDGSLAGLTQLSGKDEEYLLDAQLIQGEWMGLEEVKKYDCHLIFQGDVWKDIIPAKTPRKPTSDQILLNTRVLVLARLLGYEMVDGRPVSYLMVSKIRKLP